MSRLALLTAKELINVLFSLGFELKRQKGVINFFSIKMTGQQ
jgi:predicted RNA binding protein YcfA (HicA-like mRNA interferase family)